MNMLWVLKHVNINKIQKMTTVYVCASSVHRVLHKVCLGDAWQGMNRHIWIKVCKTHTQWSKHDGQVQSWEIPKFGTHWSSKQLKNATWNKFEQSPIKNLNNFRPKTLFPTPFSKIPKSSKPRKFST